MGIRWLDPLVQRALDDKRRAQKAGIDSPVADKTFMQHLADSTDGTLPLFIVFLFVNPSNRSRPHPRPASQCIIGLQGHSASRILGVKLDSDVRCIRRRVC